LQCFGYRDWSTHYHLTYKIHFTMSSSIIRRSQRVSLRHKRNSSPESQSHQEKRLRSSIQARNSPPFLEKRPQSAISSTTSSSASIGQFYGLGDNNALDNLFASYPQALPSFPRPHGAQGLLTPEWQFRYDHEIYLWNDFFPGPAQMQRVRAPVPSLELNPFPSEPPESPPSAQQPPTSMAREMGVVTLEFRSL
jgi:hypothetical protein